MLEQPADRQPVLPRLYPYLLLSVAAGIWVSLGEIHQYHNSDSLIPVLVSLYRWTFFYWEQDRFGMLVPLLALPFNHPLANLVVQTAVSAAAGIAAWFLIARYLVRAPFWPLAGAAAGAGFLLTAPAVWRFMWLSTFQPYNVSLALGFGALLAASGGRQALRPARLVGALVLTLLACWVNAAVVMLLLPLVTFRGLLVPPDGVEAPPSAADGRRNLVARLVAWSVRSELVPAVPLLLLGFISSQAAQRLAPYRTTWIVLPALREWAGLLREMATNIQGALGVSWLWPLVLLAAGLPLWLSGRAGRPAWRPAAAAILTACSYTALMGILFHARERYFLPALVLTQVALAGLAVAPFARPFRRAAAPLLLVCVAAVMVCVAAVNGVPGTSRVRADLDRTIGQLTPDLLDGECTHLAGDYWNVWSSVYHANLVLHEQQPGHTIWGLTHRSWPTRPQWSGTPTEKLRVAALRGDQMGEYYLRMYDLPPLHPGAEVGSIVIWLPDRLDDRRSAR